MKQKKPEAKTEDLTKPKGAKKVKTKVDQQQIIVDLNARKHKRFSNFDHPSKMFSFFKQETNSEWNTQNLAHFNKKKHH